MKSKRIATIDTLCVACGTCMKECPFGAISIPTGIKALVNLEICVGCGKCSKVCPASVITIVEREVAYEN
ncbi:4Fe-4S dicluster domain-containing protein [Chakrabartyella piscis]|uniref:ATP-binding protein n=1 Tax=Chakrabartyella piscis TaxID=2918914 RepID=UPI002F40E7FE